MEKSKKAANYRLPTAFWISLVLLGIASFWRLFIALNKGLDVFGYIDFFIAMALIVVGALMQNKWRNYLVAAGLVILVVFTQIVNQGFGFDLGGIFLSGSALLAIRYASDLIYYILMLVIAFLLIFDKHKTAGIVAIAAAVFSLIYTGIAIANTTQYTGDFEIAWEWWLENSMLVPMYFVCTLILAVTLFFFEYDKIDRFFRERDKARKIEKNTVKKSGRKISA